MSARKIVRTIVTLQKNIVVGIYNELSWGQSGGNHIKTVVIHQTGKPINKNGRLFPNFPGFLLSMITPNIMAAIAPTISCEETPIDTRRAFRLTV